MRGQQLVRAATVLNQVLARQEMGRLKTREQVEARVEKILAARRVQSFFRVRVREEAVLLRLDWDIDAEAIT